MSMFVITLLAGTVAVAEAVPDGVGAAFAGFEERCAHDAGKLWGRSLCGGVLIADFEAGRLYASDPDPNGTLPAVGDVYAGPLPASLPRANTGVDWQGRRWTLVLWPLPDDPAERMCLLVHESFHRIQPELGLDGQENRNAHLDEADGRVWMRLEWRALREALTGKDRHAALADALALRRHRHRLVEAARAAEWALEINEGLAEYTGVRLAYPGEAAAERAAEALARADGWDHLARRFAYASGPAWGLLLDHIAPDWRSRVLAGADFTDIAGRALPSASAEETKARDRARAYGLEAVEAEEIERASERASERESLRALLLGPDALVLPLAEAQMSFDPRSVSALPPEGTIYRGLTVTDLWGRIEVEGPALISPDFTSLRVSPVTEIVAGGMTGADWTLALDTGWTFAEGRLTQPESPAASESPN